MFVNSAGYNSRIRFGHSSFKKIPGTEIRGLIDKRSQLITELLNIKKSYIVHDTLKWHGRKNIKLAGEKNSLHSTNSKNGYIIYNKLNWLDNNKIIDPYNPTQYINPKAAYTQIAKLKWINGQLLGQIAPFFHSKIRKIVPFQSDEGQTLFQKVLLQFFQRLGEFDPQKSELTTWVGRTIAHPDKLRRELLENRYTFQIPRRHFDEPKHQALALNASKPISLELTVHTDNNNLTTVGDLIGTTKYAPKMPKTDLYPELTIALDTLNVLKPQERYYKELELKNPNVTHAEIIRKNGLNVHHDTFGRSIKKAESKLRQPENRQVIEKFIL